MKYVDSGIGLAFIGLLCCVYFFFTQKKEIAFVFSSLASLILFLLVLRFGNQANLSSPALQFGLFLQVLLPVLLSLFAQVDTNNKTKTHNGILAIVIVGIVVLIMFLFIYQIYNRGFSLEVNIIILFVLYAIFAFTKDIQYLTIGMCVSFAHIFALASAAYLQGILELKISIAILLILLTLLPIWLGSILYKRSPQEGKAYLNVDNLVMTFILFAVVTQLRFMFI